MAASLQKEPGLQVALVDGNHGEFTVSVDGRTVAQKQQDALPTLEAVLAAVKEPATAMAK